MNEYTVHKYLNVRAGRPSLSAPCYQFLAPGSVLQTDGRIYKGDPFEGVDDWLKDEAGNYYWSGGVIGASKNEAGRSDYWFSQLGIDTIWQTFGEKGSRARVLVLDTGINDFLPVFEGAVAEGHKINFVNGSRDLFSNDQDCHGTHCAGLIAARPGQYSVGVAPECQLLIGKISEDGMLGDGATMRRALEAFLAPQYEFDIISISATMMQEDAELRRLIDEHIQKNRIVLAAIGNDPLSRNLPYKKYPGYFDSCISVGACEYDRLISGYTCSPQKATIHCFGTHIGSYQKSSIPRPLKGTSQATAIMAGICALAVSFLKKRNRSFNQETFRQLLQSSADPLENFHAALVNPVSLFHALKTL